jgi:hypothetical protein
LNATAVEGIPFSETAPAAGKITYIYIYSPSEKQTMRVTETRQQGLSREKEYPMSLRQFLLPSLGIERTAFKDV